MDRKEAILRIKDHMEHHGIGKYPHLKLKESLDMAIAALSQPNEPLTLEKLRGMDGEPVYDYLGQEWYVIQEYYDHELTMTDGTRFFDDDEIDGVDKRFYRHPPEGGKVT